jgi:phosphate transport system substrate-binding protein
MDARERAGNTMTMKKTSVRIIKITTAFALLIAFVLFSAGSLRAADKVITIGGTGCALGGMKEVARAFRAKHPEVVFHFPPSLGSSGSIRALLAGAVDLALSSRPVSEEERRQGAVSAEYARTPFIFVTSHKGRLPDLTMEKLAAIYAGKTKTWPDGAPLRLILRPAGDMDTAYLKDMSPAMDKAVKAALSRPGMVTAVTDQDAADMVGRIRGGFGALTLAQLVAERRPLKPLSVNGVAPGLRALADGSYPYYKTLSLVTGPNTGEETRAFIKFVNSPEGRSILTKTGHLVLRDGK